jgi:hypothetical protein
MVELNAGSASQVLTLFGDLVKPVPASVKKRLGDAVVKATHGDKALNSRATKVLEDAGYSTSGGIFKKKTVDTSAD